ncbi:uncharacterized protein N7511_007995 [Penicillium nucicola]|uniref:uncharacterized protein n=1 Tax=Penicillium nucicola TaxID=1850975 RepID=UPI002545320F|nr:uncharacterized protein N7511_007995 [Penicillium nucicola]KAJ5753842.1 hypothetical protein N7511_007995 [Penicillium nucicola]
MSSKRRSAAAASPDVRRVSKRRKISDDDLTGADVNNQALSHLDSDPASADENETPESQAESEVGFEGDSLQTAQDKIMSELTRLKDSDGEDVSYPFIGKPDRNLYKDYYEIIQHPVSLRSIQKKVRGTDSRKNSSRATAYPTWNSFEEEVGWIWRNAREYNEDDSDISVLAGILERHFKERVAEAKKLVPDQLQMDGNLEMPRIKLKMGTGMPEPAAQRLSLKLSAQASDTAFKDNNHQSSSVAVDEELLTRQQGHVRTESIGQHTNMSPRTRSLRGNVESPESSAANTLNSADQHQGLTNGRGMSNPIKNETGTSQDSPDTFAEASATEISHHSSSSAHISFHQPLGTSPTDSFLRRPGQDASTSLIQNVQIVSHASLSLQHSFRLDVPPSSRISQQNITVNLPASHSLLTVKPRLAASTTQRQVKIVALVGLQRLHSSGDANTLAYDVQLHPGMTRIDLEAIVGPATGVPKSGPPGSDVDYERVTMFFNLLR